MYKDHYLICINCNHKYEFKNEIPILIDKISPYNEGQIQYFDEYSKDGPIFTAWMDSYLKRFFENLNPKKGNVVLDIATGDGYMAIELAKRGFKVIALDLSLAMLLKLKEKVKRLGIESKVLLVCADATFLPIKNKIADIVTANAILEHLPEEKEAIKEIERVTKYGAGLMVATPLAYRYIWPFFIPINFYHDKKIGHLRRYTRKKLEERFINWKTINVFYTGHLLKVLLFILAYIFRFRSLDKTAEKVDNLFKNIPYGASNITIFFRKYN